MRCFPSWPVKYSNGPVTRTGCHRFLGDLSEEDPPVPIPNTAVKLLSPDGTAQATVWESRKSPGLIPNKGLHSWRPLSFCAPCLQRACLPCFVGPCYIQSAFDKLRAN